MVALAVGATPVAAQDAFTKSHCEKEVAAQFERLHGAANVSKVDLGSGVSRSHSYKVLFSESNGACAYLVRTRIVDLRAGWARGQSLGADSEVYLSAAPVVTLGEYLQHVDRDVPTECRVGERTCRSRNEWDLLVAMDQVTR